MAGGIVNRSIVVAAVKRIVEHLNPTRLHKHGGDINTDRAWAQSFLDRLGYVRRKGTKAARKLPPDFDDVKSKFLERISEACRSGTSLVPPPLIINFDQQMQSLFQ